MFRLLWWTPLALALSPWSSAEWRLNLEFVSDTEDNTKAPRLALPCQVLIESTPQSVQDEFMLGSFKSDCITVLEDATFVNMQGEQTVRFGDTGGWKILNRRSGKAGDAGQVRMFLDILNDFSKNDLEFQAQRIYLTSNCWRQEEFTIGSKRLQPLKFELEEYQTQIQERLEHETGDRRLDGTNLVDTAMGSIDMGILVTKRDEARFRLSQAETKLPNVDSVTSGAWPGSTEPLYIAKGCIEIKEPLLLGKGYKTVGSWTATPVETDDEYEYYYEDDDEEMQVSEHAD